MSLSIDLRQIFWSQICHFSLNSHFKRNFYCDCLIGATDAVFPKNELIIQTSLSASRGCHNDGGRRAC